MDKALTDLIQKILSAPPDVARIITETNKLFIQTLDKEADNGPRTTEGSIR